MLADRLVDDVPIEQSADGFDVSVRMPWYRALPLSCVRGYSVTVDGTEYPAEQLRFVVNGEVFDDASIADRWQENWYVLDTAKIRVLGEQLAEGTHQVDVGLSLQIPYLPIGPRALVITEHNSKELTTEVAV